LFYLSNSRGITSLKEGRPGQPDREKTAAMRNTAIATLALIASLAAPAAARETLAYGMNWNMRQDLATMDAPQPWSALTIAQQRAQRAAYQQTKARPFGGTGRRSSMTR